MGVSGSSRSLSLSLFLLIDHLARALATTTNWTKWTTQATAKSANVTTVKPSNATASGNSSASSNGTTTIQPTTTTSSSKSKLMLFGGIGIGVLVLLLIVLLICKRRKRQQARRNTVARHMARSSSKRVKTKHDEAFGGGGGNAYNHMDTSKAGGGGAYGSYQPRKLSDPVLLEDASRDSDTTYMSAVPSSAATDEALSVDGMLGDAPLTPVVLGGGGGRHTGKSLKTAGAAKTNNGFTSVNDLVTQDISIRCTTSANVFDEYLRMKQEMNYDQDDDGMSDVLSEMSDLDSDTMSLHKFSLESSQGIVGIGALARHDGGLSITDSEYDEHMRNRGASECYSEMSYNDEKYSFSEDDEMSSEFARSKVGGGSGTSVPDREVEI